jgi:hypothetical protein
MEAGTPFWVGSVAGVDCDLRCNFEVGNNPIARLNKQIHFNLPPSFGDGVGIRTNSRTGVVNNLRSLFLFFLLASVLIGPYYARLASYPRRCLLSEPNAILWMSR